MKQMDCVRDKFEVFVRWVEAVGVSIVSESKS